MKRLIDWHLADWEKEKRRKPLLLKGARQIGKTYSVRQLGKRFESFVEINFELVPEAKTIFEKDLKPDRIIWELGLLTNTEIISEKKSTTHRIDSSLPSARITLTITIILLHNSARTIN
ncbi:MAG: hypothetical protein K1000chlam4_00151 [Chlamydiae bacterium]|nr:hypothetical protein [Chlamydiota bacterium]